MAEQNNNFSLRIPLNKTVFIFSGCMLIGGAFFLFFLPQQSAHFLAAAQAFTGHNLSWYYTLVMLVCLVFVLWLAGSKYGNIKLGPPDEAPEYSYFSWVAMLFSSGIGIALIYFGCYEPIDHFLHPPTGAGGSALAAQNAMVITFFHWGVHGWALYALVATVTAYFAYIEKLGFKMRSPLSVFLPAKRVAGRMGDCVDAFTIISTIIAMVSNLGLGALLIQGGLSRLFVIFSTKEALFVVCILLALFSMIISAVNFQKGLALFSRINILCLCCLLALVFLCGPTAHLMDALVQNIGDYLSQFIKRSFNLYIYQNAEQWRSLWTIFYWAWWVSWAPFVGLFIARISRGRTIRQLVLGVMFIPLAFTLLWLCLFGNTALDLILLQHHTALGSFSAQRPEMAVFSLLEMLPLAKVTVPVAILACFLMFFAPMDSGAEMVATLSLKNASSTQLPPAYLKIFWIIATTLLTLGLFWSGNFVSIEIAVILCALPFSAILLLYIWALYSKLKSC